MSPSLNSNNTNTIKFLYSYAGQILPRPTDGKLRYVGGFTRILAMDRSVTFAELMVKFGESCGSSMNLRCKLPCEDLDLLVSVTCDKDLATVIEEYDRVSSSTHKEIKIRAILFPIKSLKKISPVPSTVSSVNFSGSNSPPYSVSQLYCLHPKTVPMRPYHQYNSRKSSPAFGFPRKFRYYPCREQERPRQSYVTK